MKTIGELLTTARREKKLTFVELSEKTKIKKKFLMALERERWERLPDFPVVSGFVKNVAGALGVDRRQAMALLRRDYPPKRVTVNPKPDVTREFRWSPRLTFFLGALMVGVVVGGYLLYQYVQFRRPPRLEIVVPMENQVIQEINVRVAGKTDEGAKVNVNNQPAYIDEEGNFETEIEVEEETNEIVVKAESRAGKVTEIRRPIRVDFSE